MTVRITGNDLLKFAAGHHREPYAPTLGQRSYYDLLARQINQVLTSVAARSEDTNSSGRINHLHSFEEGLLVNLGEVLSERCQDVPQIGDGPDEMPPGEWAQECGLRAHRYLEWLQPLLDQKREEAA